VKRKATIEFPDPFVFEDGRRIRTAADWKWRRREIHDLVVGIEYGGLPPTPAACRCEELHASDAGGLPGVRYVSHRVITGTDRQFSFMLYLLIPPGDGPFPVVLTGDECWRYVTDKVAAEVIRRGYILAQFNRVEIAPDVYNSDRVTGLYAVHPEGVYGALAAWAWGYHRCVDVLNRMKFVDAARIGIVGHSRGGKTALLAGATDERIAVTCANNSGSGGAGCYRWQGPESETLADTIRMIPYWFGPRLKTFVGRENEMPFDQHFLKALVAPRALLTCEALGDLWANPTGTWQSHTAAREVYRFLGAEKHTGTWYREGGHDHGFADWCAFLDFMDWQLRGKPGVTGFGRDPFPSLPRAFSWRATMPRA